MVSAASKTGSGILAFPIVPPEKRRSGEPPRALNAETIPFDFINAFEQALRIISWQENLSSDEMPEPWKWHLDWEIQAHFEKVEQTRKEKWGTPDTPASDAQAESLWDENANDYGDRFKRY